MQKNPFITLGVNENITQSELFEAYRELRSKYSDLRFRPGEEGSDACLRLEEIEAAYLEARSILQSKSTDTSADDAALDMADKAIRDKKMDEAQSILDNCPIRSARWHYLQAAVFYQKNWVSDAVKQMEFAVSKDPSNLKYAETKKLMLDQMFPGQTQKPQNNQAQSNSFYRENNNGRSYQDFNENGQQRRGCSACECCQGLICADCCCECMGGDLIRCC